MIVSHGQMLTGHDIHSGSLITYFCKKKRLNVNMRKLFFGITSLTCPPVSSLEQF